MTLLFTQGHTCVSNVKNVKLVLYLYHIEDSVYAMATKHGMMVNVDIAYILILVWMILMQGHSHSCKDEHSVLNYFDN